MIQLSNALIRAAIQRLGYPDPEVGKLHILGLRGATPTSATEITRCENLPDRYNDVICTFGTTLFLAKATVDPGATYTRTPLHPKGAAHLLNGCWTHKRGLHKGRPALVQAAPVRIWRDTDKDYKRDPAESSVYDGWFGINIHAGGTSPSIGAWSAGCPAIAGGWTGTPWTTFMRLINAADQETYRFYMMDAKELVEEEA